MAARLLRQSAFAARSASAVPRMAATPAAARFFHASRPAFVKVGQAVPDLEVLVEDSPGNKVNLAAEFKNGDGVIVGVPGAFSGGCSQTHVPSYITHPKLKEAGQVFVVSVNDAFVMKAWADAMDPTKDSKIRFLGDPAGEFTKALDLDFDATALFGNPRSKRYALVIENGKVKSAHVEPDSTGIDVSLAKKVLKSLFGLTSSSLAAYHQPQHQHQHHHRDTLSPSFFNHHGSSIPVDETVKPVLTIPRPSKRKAAEATIPAEGRSLRQRRPPEGTSTTATATASASAASSVAPPRIEIDLTSPTSAPASSLSSPTVAVPRDRVSIDLTLESPAKPKTLERGPPTPQTGKSVAMDSDDDFMSTLSSEDDAMHDDSDNGTMTDNEGFDDFDDFGDDEPDDLDIDLDKDVVSDDKTKKKYDVDFKVFGPDDINKQQEELINEVNMILEMRPEDAAILLRHFRWNRERLIEEYMDRPNKTLEAAGLGPNVVRQPKLEVIPGFMCDICCEDDEDLETFALKCGHRYCVDCYRHYLTQKIREEGEAARIQCPTADCGRIIDASSLEVLVTPALAGRYRELLNRTYVEDKESLKWCPAPNCENAVDCWVKKKDLDRIVPTVECSCGYRFCFGCSLMDHLPAPCRLVKLWLKKCADDSETANWISANTKECPKCNSTIEKNGGCNHMTCRKCKYEFCWMCMGLWSEHGTSWYNCNRFEEKSGTDARDAQAKSRVSLERYLHYYNRYANHEQSARLDKDSYNKTELKMMQLQTASGMSWIEVQYLQAASQALQTCRQTLKWTYAFAFYLARNNLTEMFEDNQKDLEMAAEALSEMFEKPLSQLADPKTKLDIIDKTSYCNKRRVTLLEYTADNLAHGSWTFNSDQLKGSTPAAVAKPARKARS